MQRGNRTNPIALKQKLANGQIVTGMQSFSAHPALIEAMGTAGMDFVTVDMEHCPTGITEVVHAVRAAETAGITPFVRIPHMDASLLGRVLDLGARGVVVPHASLETCRAAVSAGKYAPQGNRGACPIVRAAGYAPASWASFAEAANNETMIIPLLEDASAVDELEDMLALPGVDVIFVGPWDLSISLGVPASNYDHPRLASVLERAVAAAKRNGKHIMTTVGATIDTNYAGRLVSKGVSLLSFSADIMVFLDACKKIAAIGSDLRR
jgi:4-hydroxy-2-oxoheptanedioate aldolase